jgi:hypothetical protein
MRRWLSSTILLLVSSFGAESFANPATGQVAIFKDDIPASGAPASPEYLGRVLGRAGFEVAFLDAEQLRDPHSLNRERFDVLVLPYGASFPVKAADNFREFLRKGGKFFSTGGYAFDNLLERTPIGWKPPGPPAPPEKEMVLWRCRISAAPLREKGSLKFSGFLKAANVPGPGMAYLAVYQFAEDGSIAQWIDFAKVTGTRDWKEFTHQFQVHPRAARVELHAGLYRCNGEAWFDGFRLTNEAGQIIFANSFEEEFNPDSTADNHWSCSDARLCQVQNTIKHSGQRALEARLSYDEPRPERLNTRQGRPADGLEVAPTQLGVFDADYRLERVASIRAAPSQNIVRQNLSLPGAFEGWAAAGLMGGDAARWMPLVNAYDRYGRLRGAAGAMLRHYGGTYAGSSWAFFGVTNRDLFADSEPAMAEALPAILRSLVRDTYVASLGTELACYRQGESVTVRANLFNGGRQSRDVRLTVRIYEGEPPEDATALGRKPCAELQAPVAVPAGKLQTVTLEWKPCKFAADFYHLLGQLWEGDQAIDRCEGAFLVRNEQVLAQGPALNFRDNYLRLGRRPMFLFGTDDWSYVFTSRQETPLQWLRDMRLRRDFGVQIYENLQFGIPQASQRDALLRKVDGLVQLAQKYQQTYFAGLLIGANVAASDAELAQHAAYCREFAKRYAAVPGLIFYLNGDLRCRLSEAVTPQLNQFLRDRHGNDESLRAAWGRNAPAQPLGSIPAEDFNDWSFAWDDVRAYDLNRFRASLIRRWSEGLIHGIREFDSTHPTTSEFYQLPHAGVDIPAGIGGLDLCNFGYFDKPGADLARFPAIFKYNDQRARGKSVGPGEYGVKTHPAWSDGQDHGYHTARTREQAVELFLAIAHYSLGLGGSRIHNWCWKDSADNVFPWGMVHACDQVPKDTAHAHRNQSLLFRHFAPVYREPEVCVLTPDSHRLGGGKWQVMEGLLKSYDLALANHVDNLGTLNEDGLVIPKSARLIFHPLPFCPSDGTYDKLRDWVRAGGTLYLSGDISYDEQRRRTRTNRLEELCGVRFVAERYRNISVKASDAADQPCIQVQETSSKVLKRASDGSPLLVENHLGRGQVFFTLDPVELHSVAARRPEDLALYRMVLNRAGVKTIGLQPDDPKIHVFRLPLQDGGWVYVLFNTDEGAAKRVTLTDLRPPVEPSVATKRPALLWFDGRRRLRAVEAQADCRAGKATVVHDETGGIVLSLDGKDVRRSGALLVMPLREGVVRIASDRKWHRPVVSTGDLRNGDWWNHATGPLTDTPASLSITVNRDQAISLLLVTEEDEISRWSRNVAQSVKAPVSLP